MYNHLIDVLAILIIKVTCLVIGYLIVKLGYNLIIEGVKGHFKFSLDYKGVKGGLISSSPGLLFLTLGVLVLVTAIKVKKEAFFEQIETIPKPVQKPLPSHGKSHQIDTSLNVYKKR